MNLDLYIIQVNCVSVYISHEEIYCQREVFFFFIIDSLADM